ncbi:MAG: hypothetical protein AAFX46_21640, partial [Cyanobacteria bacterium J06636_27]
QNSCEGDKMAKNLSDIHDSSPYEEESLKQGEKMIQLNRVVVILTIILVVLTSIFIILEVFPTV